ncbi:hypothetical protein TcWFU_006762 [Taenia crassiceps]|uniref:Uncharacterized protein n=1 Tax=Taenia crassiceps TaxID=6207 RepID=A0ABR4Q254_9CEST
MCGSHRPLLSHLSFTHSLTHSLISPHRTAPHRTAPHRTAPHSTPPQLISSLATEPAFSSPLLHLIHSHLHPHWVMLNLEFAVGVTSVCDAPRGTVATQLTCSVDAESLVSPSTQSGCVNGGWMGDEVLDK